MVPTLDSIPECCFSRTRVNFGGGLRGFPQSIRISEHASATFDDWLVRGYNSFEAEFPAINLAVLGGTHDEFAGLPETARINAVEVESSEGTASELCSLMDGSPIP